MFKIRTLSRLSPILLLAVLALVPMAAPVFSQANTCPAFVTKIVQQARTVCSAVDSGQICFADALTSQFADAKASLAKAGDMAPLSSLKLVAGQAADVNKESWGVGLLKLHAALPGDNTLTMAVLGDAKVTNLV